MNYDINYFIDKFSKIPNRMWTVGSDGWKGIEGKYCADGYCGSNGGHQTEESKALALLLHPLLNDCPLIDVVWKINDGNYEPYHWSNYPEPKERILAALYDLKIQEANIKEAKELVNKEVETVTL